MNEARCRIRDIVWPILGIIAAILLCLLAVNACVVMTMPIPNRFKLGVIADGHQTLSAFWPYGHHHELILGVPGAEWDHPPAFSASIQFVHGERIVVDLTVRSTNVVSCNWLHSKDVQGFVLTCPNTNEWDHSLVPGQEYSILFDLADTIPSNSTLWVSCLQSGIHRWKTRRNRTRESVPK